MHGDYDLYDIIDPDEAQRNLAAVESLLGHPHLRGANFYRVQSFVNSAIGVPMIQHGGEMQYADHSEQAIDAFGHRSEVYRGSLGVRDTHGPSFQGGVDYDLRDPALRTEDAVPDAPR